MTSILARNLSRLLCKNQELLEPIPATFPQVYFINFGKHGDGVMIWNDFVLRGHSRGPLSYLLNIRKLKKLIEWLNMQDLSGQNSVATKVLNVQYAAMDMAFWVFSLRLTSCLPCHISKGRGGRKEKRELIKGKLHDL